MSSMSLRVLVYLYEIAAKRILAAIAFCAGVDLGGSVVFGPHP
jgi:hypothetical protein